MWRVIYEFNLLVEKSFVEDFTVALTVDVVFPMEAFQQVLYFGW